VAEGGEGQAGTESKVDFCGVGYPPIPRRRVVVGKRRKPLEPSRVSLLTRLYRTTARQVFDIEQRLAVPAGAAPERERDVRMLAVLTRMLRDLAALSPGGGGEGGDKAAADDDPVPEDIDEFRRQLAQRVRGFIAARQAEREGGADQRGAIGKS
jgi:hypothetical protein